MRLPVRLCAGALSVGVAAFLLAVLLPRALGVGWSGTEDQLDTVSRWDLATLTLVWAAGLWLHTIVLQRSLPGLSRRRAFALNLGGSSISNVMPLGGAAGIGLNYAMLRSWGYNRGQIVSFATISNLVVALVKVAVAGTGLVALLFMPAMAAQVVRPTSPGAIGLCVAAGLMTVTTVSASIYLRRRRESWAALWLAQSWHQCVLVVRRGWAGLAVGGLGYPMLQALLLWMCLMALHVHASVGAVLAAYAVERLFALIPLTPGGVGLVETAATATLVGFGADPVGALAGVVLFRVFSYLIEIPLGAVVAAAWFARARHASVSSPGADNS